jgi:pseudaminic acid cytidylyltransferase
MKIAIIPARGGSKRIPRKNIKDFCGKPMISYSINAALSTGFFDKVIVSTDDPEIADISKTFGAEVPFVRPSELSNDFTTTVPVIKHAIEWVSTNIANVDYACCIYATAPFVQSQDIVRAYDTLINDNIQGYVFTATTFPFPIQRAFKLNKDGFVCMFNPENYNTRSQDLEEAFQDAGQFYWGASDTFKQDKIFFSTDSKAFVLPRHQVQDIDTLEDWRRAELMFKAFKINESFDER